MASRRLAALALSIIEINQSTNVETVDFLLSGYSDKDLFECALSRLSDIKVLINSSYIQASLICIERIYGLSSPLINPFPFRIILLLYLVQRKLILQLLINAMIY